MALHNSNVESNPLVKNRRAVFDPEDLNMENRKSPHRYIIYWGDVFEKVCHHENLIVVFVSYDENLYRLLILYENYTAQTEYLYYTF